MLTVGDRKGPFEVLLCSSQEKISTGLGFIFLWVSWLGFFDLFAVFFPFSLCLVGFAVVFIFPPSPPSDVDMTITKGRS